MYVEKGNAPQERKYNAGRCDKNASSAFLFVGNKQSMKLFW